MHALLHVGELDRTGRERHHRPDFAPWHVELNRAVSSADHPSDVLHVWVARWDGHTSSQCCHHDWKGERRHCESE
jgi:hypothetical protein